MLIALAGAHVQLIRMLMKVSAKLAAGCSEDEMVELLAGIPGVQLVGQRSSWLNYR